jgi:ribonuclease BN (tRNA processing enzyme)
MSFARKAEVGTVVLFHHDPYHTDDELELLLAEARTQWNGLNDQVRLAYEGLTIELDGTGVHIAP